jgi:hypothetical protein
MATIYFPPVSLKAAGVQLREGFSANVTSLTHPDFIQVWAAIVYLFPSLHPDTHGLPDTNWPRALHRFADEAWRRYEAGELSDAELYPSDTISWK